MSNPGWIQKLQSRWHLNSVGKVFIILAVFACTGFTVMFLKPVITGWLFKSGHSTWFSILYWILILPIYNLFLLFYGFLLGKFQFFWEFEKKLLYKINFRKKIKTDPNSKKKFMYR
jgi:hypothetical protein